MLRLLHGQALRRPAFCRQLPLCGCLGVVHRPGYFFDCHFAEVEHPCGLDHVCESAVRRTLSMLASYDFRMATRTVIELIDDLDGSQASETLRFGLDGTDYEIDLGEQNAEALRGELARFVKAGRRDAARKSQPPTVRRLSPAADLKTVRAWAAENGIEVNPRGRVREDVLQQYLATLS